MTPASSSSTELKVLAEKIDNLKNEAIRDLRSDIYDAVSAIKAVVDKFTNFQVEYEKRHTGLEARTENAHDRLDQVEKNLEKVQEDYKNLSRSVDHLYQTVKLISKIFWVFLVAFAVPFVISVFGFLWLLLSHQIEMIVK